MIFKYVLEESDREEEKKKKKKKKKKEKKKEKKREKRRETMPGFRALYPLPWAQQTPMRRPAKSSPLSPRTFAIGR